MQSSYARRKSSRHHPSSLDSHEAQRPPTFPPIRLPLQPVIMCQWMRGSVHACGHSRTQSIVERCRRATDTQRNCPNPTPVPVVYNSKCTACRERPARAGITASLESWSRDFDRRMSQRRSGAAGGGGGGARPSPHETRSEPASPLQTHKRTHRPTIAQIQRAQVPVPGPAKHSAGGTEVNGDGVKMPEELNAE